ncbi:MAG TPA: hypothetical protein VJB82_00655 [Candidatus Peribacterales bacterium]|nr:hypothetical protein [Candidatus Peribacterales bacterium]
MKRTLAFLVTFSIFLTFTPMVSAQSLGVNPTRWGQPRVSQRMNKTATLHSYAKRWNLALRRERYRGVVAQMMQGMPATLAVTGGNDRSHPDYIVISRPTARGVDAWRLSSHCMSDDDKYNTFTVSGREMCTQVDE